MTRDASPFDHRPDEALGSALREALTAGDDGPFVRQVLGAAETVFGEGITPGWWFALAEWARPQVVAAMLVAAAVGFWFGMRAGAAGVGETPTPLDPLATGTEQLSVPVMLAGYEPPGMGEVMGAVLDLAVRNGSTTDARR
jgi:hypothetical protein